MPKLPITNVVSVFQYQRTGNKESYQGSATYINVNACISPTGTDIQPSGEVAAFQLFEVYLYDVTLQIHTADKIIDENGLSYIVDGKPYIINNQYLQYIRCLCRQVV